VPDDLEPEPGDRLLVPLYLEQLQGLGLATNGAQTLPPRLADAVAQRIQRLNVSTRRLLQAIAVLGRSANRSSVEYVAEHEYMASLPQLLARGMVVETGGSLEIIHPFVRDLVEASVPAEARRTLHLRALELATRVDAPLEVRAHHAYGSGETLSALVLLERLGDVSAARGDIDTAVLGYQRGIEIARREVLESGDTSLDDVLASLGRRLGVLLSRRGDVGGAEGVLREALEHSSPSGLQRAPILVALARVVSQRNREREAYRLLGQALELAYRDDAVLAQADVQVALAELRRKEKNVKSAIGALKAVVELLTEQGADAARCATVFLELAEAQLEDRDWHAAEATLQKAAPHVEETGLPYARARALGLRARMHSGRGELGRALALFREASALAAFAGAAELVRTLEDSAKELSSGVPGRREDPARNAAN
jgi:tetratricopeptide (TPR) repeat protein